MGLGGSIEAARLFVGVGVQGGDRAAKELGGLGSSVQKTGGFLKGAASQALGFGTAMLGLQAAGGVADFVGGAVIGMNATLEKSTLQFETLMGDADKAGEHVKGLFEFAKRTPFEAGPIIEASRIMQTFGGDALNTTKNLELFGDASAATSAPISDVAFWTSRAYAAIQGGKPFGEARMRLMELGIITPQVADKMEELQASGASSSEVWALMESEMGKFSGAMEKQSGTWEGLTSSLSDTLNLTIAGAFRPFFESAKGLVGGALEFFSDPGTQAAITGFSELIVGGLGKAVGFIGRVFGQVRPYLEMIAGAIGDVIGAAGPLVDVLTGAGGALDGVGEKAAAFAQTLYTKLGELAAQVVPMLADLGRRFVEWIGPMIPVLLEQLALFGQSMFAWIMGALPGIVDQLLVWAGAFIDWIVPMIPPMLAKLVEFVGAAAGWIVSTGLPMLWNTLVQLGGKLIAWIGPRIGPMLGELGKFLAAAVGWIVTKGIPMLLGAALKLGGALVSGVIDFVLGKGGQPGLITRLSTFLTGTLLPAMGRWAIDLGKAGLKWAGELIGGLIDGIKKAPGRLANAFVNLLRSILPIKLGPLTIGRNAITLDAGPLGTQTLATYQKGTPFVPSTGPAYLHRGEAVLPLEVARAFRSFFGGGAAAPVAAAGGGGGGPVVIYVTIGTFYGTEENTRSLGRELGRQARLETLRRTG